MGLITVPLVSFYFLSRYQIEDRYPPIFTIYISPEYSEKKFKKIRKGMSPNKVQNTLGRPVGIGQSGPWEIWLYAQKQELRFTAHGGEVHYRRMIRFKNNKVKEIVRKGSFKHEK